jgi:hypothetical protein
MHAVLDDLYSEAYLVKMVAATSAGTGPPTDVIKIEMGVAAMPSGTGSCILSINVVIVLEEAEGVVLRKLYFNLKTNLN